eukprot:scaffold657693_cov59-Prasinocladus_malaysianus.AAC.1
MECAPQADAGPGETNPNNISLCTHLEPVIESGRANVKRPVTLIWKLPGACMPEQCFILRRLHTARRVLEAPDGSLIRVNTSGSELSALTGYWVR